MVVAESCESPSARIDRSKLTLYCGDHDFYELPSYFDYRWEPLWTPGVSSHKAV